MADKRVRRSYTKAFRRRVVAETFEPGASVAAVAREHGVNANMLFGWRKDPRWMPRTTKAHSDISFLPVEIADEGDVPPLSSGSTNLAPSSATRQPEASTPQAGYSAAPSSAVTKLELTLHGGRQLSLEGTFRLSEIAALARELDEA